MQLALPGNPHLTYCTNIHAGETWSEIASSLERFLPAIKNEISPSYPMGVGLRLSAVAADELAAPATLEAFRAFLLEHDLYVFTVNAFPYGPFHGSPVKERVYEPDWRTSERLLFTTSVADILAALAPANVECSISTVPGAFRSHIKTPADIARIRSGMVACAAHLFNLRRASGHSIVLAIEPEPACFLETTEEAIDFIQRELFGPSAVSAFAKLTNTSSSEAKAGLRHHIGLCFDVCHSAVAFENAKEALAAIESAGIRVAKVQLSAALQIACTGVEIEPLLAAFDDGVYLHQTVHSRGRDLCRYTDLADAFASLRNGEKGGDWRVHCHVPVFLDRFDGLQSTQATLREVLGLCRERPVSPHLEVETYTWSVLPPSLRHGDLAGDIVRELKWVRSELGA
ncbi:MAG: metabolite traffic protein EboE [Hyphomicrobium sp.]|nr:metabolite traffic protein EboE [Hyphomicrobium sp.]